MMKTVQASWDFQTQLSHQTKKYDSKHCGARSDSGTTRAKVSKALSEMRTGRKSMV
jgi:hypothetical protein